MSLFSKEKEVNGRCDEPRLLSKGEQEGIRIAAILSGKGQPGYAELQLLNGTEYRYLTYTCS